MWCCRKDGDAQDEDDADDDQEAVGIGAADGEVSVAGSVGAEVSGDTPPDGELVTTTVTKPPDLILIADATRRPVDDRAVLCRGGHGVLDDVLGCAVVRPGGAATSVTQYEPGPGGVQTAKPNVASTWARTGASPPLGSYRLSPSSRLNSKLAPPTIRSSSLSGVP